MSPIGKSIVAASTNRIAMATADHYDINGVVIALRHFYVADGFNAIVKRNENKLPTISECAAK